MVRQSWGDEDTRQLLVRNIKRYLNLNRKQFRAFDMQFLQESNSFNDPTFDLNILEYCVGTYYVLKIVDSNKYPNEKAIWVSCFRIGEDYDSEFFHAENRRGREKYNCAISVTNPGIEMVVMNIQVMNSTNQFPISYSSFTVKKDKEIGPVLSSYYIDNSNYTSRSGKLDLLFFPKQPDEGWMKIKTGVFERAESREIPIEIKRHFHIDKEGEWII